jgi:transposase
VSNFLGNFFNASQTSRRTNTLRVTRQSRQRRAALKQIDKIDDSIRSLLRTRKRLEQLAKDLEGK